MEPRRNDPSAATLMVAVLALASAWIAISSVYLLSDSSLTSSGPMMRVHPNLRAVPRQPSRQERIQEAKVLLELSVRLGYSPSKTPSPDESYSEGALVDAHAVDLNEENWDAFMEQNLMAFVDFYTPGFVWSQRLPPTWETYAQEAKNTTVPGVSENLDFVGIGKVDCMAHSDLCRQQGAQSWPALHWYLNGAVFQCHHETDKNPQSLWDVAERQPEANSSSRNTTRETDGVDDAHSLAV